MIIMNHSCLPWEFQVIAKISPRCDRVTVPVGLVLLDERVAGDEVAGYGSGFDPSVASSYTSAPSSSACLSRKTHADERSFETFLLWDERFHFGWKLHILHKDKRADITVTPWETTTN